jgi:hypothetical protein
MWSFFTNERRHIYFKSRKCSQNVKNLYDYFICSDFGVHIDGFIALVAHTVVVPGSAEEN